MISSKEIELAIPMASALLGGTIVSILNFYLAKHKTTAEIAKLEAETERIRLEIGKLGSATASVSYGLSGYLERIIYDSSRHDVRRAFHGKEAYLWTKSGDNYVKSGGVGRGALRFEPGEILSIERTNTEGRYQVWLERYDDEKSFVPRDCSAEGLRNFGLSCEAKAIGIEHSLKFILKSEDSEGRWLAVEERRISENLWTPVTVHFRISPAEDFRLRIDDEEVAHAPSSVQIRKLVLSEKASN